MKIFQSPVCPICGFENDAFVPEVSVEADKSASPTKNPLKRLMKWIVWTLTPNVECKPYWIIVRFERNTDGKAAKDS